MYIYIYIYIEIYFRSLSSLEPLLPWLFNFLLGNVSAHQLFSRRGLILAFALALAVWVVAWSRSEVTTRITRAEARSQNQPLTWRPGRCDCEKKRCKHINYLFSIYGFIIFYPYPFLKIFVKNYFHFGKPSLHKDCFPTQIAIYMIIVQCILQARGRSVAYY